MPCATFRDGSLKLVSPDICGSESRSVVATFDGHELDAVLVADAVGGAPAFLTFFVTQAIVSVHHVSQSINVTRANTVAKFAAFRETQIAFFAEMVKTANIRIE